jgi:putative ATP-binding cassette transporter
VHLMLQLVRGNLVKWFAAMGAGVLAGAGGAGMVATINRVLIVPASAANDFFFNFLWCLIALIAGRTASHMLLARVTEDAVFRLRVMLSRRILDLPYASIERIGAGRLLTTLTEDVHSLSAGMMALPEFVTSGAIILGCFVYLGWLSPSFLLLLMTALLFGLAGNRFISVHYGNRNYQRARDSQDWLLSHFRTLTIGAKELKLNRTSREVFLRRDVEETGNTIRGAMANAASAYALAYAWFLAVLLGLLGGVLFYASDRWFEREIFAGYVLAFLFMIGPITQIMSMMDVVALGGIALRKIRHLNIDVDNQPGVHPGADADLLAGDLALALRELKFSYQPNQWGEQFEVGPLDTLLQSGKITFVIGGNGSGKSTLLKVLCGLYTPSAGALVLNGTSLRAENLDWYRDHIACVFADFHVWYRLIDGVAEAGRGEARAIAQRLGLPGGLWETGFWQPQLPLSEGQKRRVALLAALMQDKPIYMFDEWAADQDARFKDYFYLELLPSLKRRGKLVVVVTHDEKYFHLADQTIKLDGRRRELTREYRQPTQAVGSGGSHE